MIVNYMKQISLTNGFEVFFVQPRKEESQAIWMRRFWAAIASGIQGYLASTLTKLILILQNINQHPFFQCHHSAFRSHL